MNDKIILIIDDDRALCDNLKDILQEDGYHLVAASTCADGLQLAREKRPMVVLLDLKLPDGWGTMLLAELKRLDPECACIIMTAHANLDSALVAIDKGAVQFLQKPINIEHLLDVLDGVFHTIRLREDKRQAEEALRVRNRELQEINDRLGMIVKSAKILAACPRLEEFGPLFLEELARNMTANGGSLFLKKDSALVLIHSLDPEHVPTALDLPLPKGCIFEQAMTSLEPIFIQDISGCDDVAKSGWRGYRDGSLLVFPLVDAVGEFVGIISLHNKACPPFSSQDREIGSILVSYSCEAIRAMRALDALRESEEELRSLNESAPDIIYALATDGRVSYVNPAWEKLLGHSRSFIIGMPFTSFVKEDSAGTYQIVLNRVRYGRETVRGVHVPLVHRDGSVRIFSVSCAPKLGVQGKVTGMLGVCKDMTDHIKLEAQLQHAQKMEAVGILAGGISHDLNNILQAISGYIQLLVMKKSPTNPDWDYLKMMDRSVDRAADLIQRLLVFSQRVESKKRPLDLNLEIEHARKLLDGAIPRMIEIRLNLLSDLKLINADPVQIEQIIMNLAVNARDAMTDGGVLTFETRNVSREEAFESYPEIEPGNYVMLSVKDTGYGMGEETLKHIFEPFFTTKGMGHGTGLGLAMVYGIIRSHEGHITCVSEPGRGTVFRIYFPVFAGEMGERKSEVWPMEEAEGGSETILLVDDETILLDLGKDMLSEFGYTVLTAESGEEALGLYEGEGMKIDLVVLDLSMPGMGGHRCFQELRRINPGVKVIVASGYTSDDKVKETLESGACGFICKPYRLQDMLKKIKDVMDTG